MHYKVKTQIGLQMWFAEVTSAIASTGICIEVPCYWYHNTIMTFNEAFYQADWQDSTRWAIGP